MSQDLDQYFYNLQPNDMLLALEEAGFRPTGKYQQLNSYENRVLDFWLEEDNYGTHGQRVIAKFYRPNRWTEEALLEEHKFISQLKEDGLQAVAPLILRSGDTLLNWQGIFMTAFPKQLGRMPDELFDEDYKKIGRKLAQLHNVGERETANHRLHLGAEDYGWPAIEILENWVAPEVSHRYFTAAEKIVEFIESELGSQSQIRIHGDCHRGNLLLTQPKEGEGEFFFVDFDDFCMGPPVQDFWMLLTGDDNTYELDLILEGYNDLRSFNKSQFNLIPALRGLRIIHYASWIGKRWEDPTFPQLFPQYLDYTYWAEETEILEKIAWSLESSDD